MLRSMTAFARQTIQGDWGQATWELKSVNHRFCDCHFKIPDLLKEKEVFLRQRIQQSVGRGKVDCSLKLSFAPRTQQAIELNWPVVTSLLTACDALSAQMPAHASLKPTDVLNWPGVMSQSEQVLDEPLWATLLEGFDAALAMLQEARVREGAATADILADKITAAEGLQADLSTRAEALRDTLKPRLMQKLAAIQDTLEPQRLEQEIVMLANRLDIDEELGRLQTHLAETRRCLRVAEPIGRRLDFLMQELNREANTIASKSADAAQTQLAVDLKVYIEQMREQIQNVE